jgi:preprotein translocase subunit SecG
MAILSTVLLVFFVIIAILLVLLVLVQNEEGDSLGGIFAGGSGSAFGSRSGNVLTRSTTVLGALFLIISLGLALLNRTPGGSGVEAAGRELSSEAAASNWLDDELNTQSQFIPEPQPSPPAGESSSLEDAFFNEVLENEPAQGDNVVTE